MDALTEALQDVQLWKSNAESALRKLQQERKERKAMEKKYLYLMWLLVHHAGVEIRIDPIAFFDLRDDWKLTQHEDIATQEIVLRAIKPKPLPSKTPLIVR